MHFKNGESIKTRGLFISFFALIIFAWCCSESSGSSTGNDSTTSQSGGETETPEGGTNNSKTSKHTQKQSENFDQQFKILLVGPSGHGKSSLINTIANLVSGKKATDQKDILIKTQYYGNHFPCTVERYQNRNVEDNIDPSYSQTIAALSYNTGTAKYVFLKQDQKKQVKKITLTIVDTPGRAYRNDSESIKNTIEQISNSTKLNAIVLVINEHLLLPHLTTNFNYSYANQFQAALPKKFKDNLIVLFTKPSGQYVTLFEKLKESGITAKNYVTFDNGALFAHTIPDAGEQEIVLPDEVLPNSDEIRIDINHTMLRTSIYNWKVNKKQLVKMVKHISEMEPR